MPSSRLFTPDEERFLREEYAHHSRAELAARFHARFGTERTAWQIELYLRNHQVRSGRTGRFEKGHTPWNGGTKGRGLTGPNPGSFRKGNVPANIKPVGYERVSKDGYVEVRVAETNPYTGFPGRFKPKHVHLWEEAHGPVPKGFAVCFADGDKRNFAPENIELVPRAELLRRNHHGYRETPAELKPAVAALAKLEVKTFERRRQG